MKDKMKPESLLQHQPIRRRLGAHFHHFADLFRCATKPRAIEQMRRLERIERIVGGWFIRFEQGVQKCHKVRSLSQIKRSARLNIAGV